MKIIEKVHAMKIAEKVHATFEDCRKGTREEVAEYMVKVEKMQVGFMPDKGTIDAVFILRRLQEEYLDKEKLYMCFVGLKKAFDRIPRKVLEWQ